MVGVLGWLLLLCFCFAGSLIDVRFDWFARLIVMIGLIGCLCIYVVC